MRNLVLLAIAGLTTMMFSCGDPAPQGTVITGTIESGAQMKVFLDKTKIPNSTMVLSQTETDDNGTFDFVFEEKLEAGVYRIRVGAKKLLLVFDGTEGDVTINGDFNTIDKYDVTITGSEPSLELIDGMKQATSRKLTLPGIQTFINESDNSLVAMQFAVSTLGRAEFADTHVAVSARVTKDYPGSEYAVDYAKYSSQLAATLASQRSKQLIQVGQPAPDISLTSPTGDTYSLSDLKGNVVLLDFWASWCGPCRRANPHVVQIYDKYNKDGFTVFSVSLDGLDARTKGRLGNDDAIQKNMEASKKRWVGAIEKDKLKWDYHVSELAKWDTKAAKMYGVTGIPKTFLIDREGNIAAVNPRNNLEEALLKVL